MCRSVNSHAANMLEMLMGAWPCRLQVRASLPEESEVKAGQGGSRGSGTL